MYRRSERLASAGLHAGADLSVASRPDIPARARRSREVLSDRRQDLCRAGTRGATWRNHRRVDCRMTKLVISSIGPASSVQDGGRFGAQRYGLTPSGAMDRLGLAAANSLAGNALLAPGVEIGPYGAAFTARDGAVRVGLSGAPRGA